MRDVYLRQKRVNEDAADLVAIQAEGSASLDLTLRSSECSVGRVTPWRRGPLFPRRGGHEYICTVHSSLVSFTAKLIKPGSVRV